MATHDHPLAIGDVVVIVVRIELWPGGDSRELEPLDEFTITNTSADDELCSYAVRHRGRMTEVRHTRRDGVLLLTLLALESLREEALAKGASQTEVVIHL